jgi:transposase
MEQIYSSRSLHHLGIVSGMIDELGLVEAIDNQLQTDGIARSVSLGTLCKALILNGLGFPSVRFTWFRHFFRISLYRCF